MSVPSANPLLARIIHSSDWHLSHLPRNPLAYFSKRLLAYGAHLLHAKRRFKADRHQPWIEKIKELNPSHIVISGDLTLTGTDEEFEHADRWIRHLRALTPHIAIIGGNHDVYVERKGDRGLFPRLSAWMSKTVSDELLTTRVSSLNLGPIECLLVDASNPTPWGDARGLFTAAMAEKLQALLSQPSSSQQRIVLCHYPLQSMLRKSQEMIGHEHLLACLKGHKNLVYLHGHTHQQHVIDERFYGYPVTCDSGCLSDPRKPSFAMLDVFANSLKIHLFNYDPLHGWQTRQTLVWAI